MSIQHPSTSVRLRSPQALRASVQDKQKIVPSLWFDTNCEEAMNFYVSVFPNSKVVSIKRYEKGMQAPGIEQMVGKVLMEFQKYPFLEKYGWCEDKFGVSWQLILSDPQGEERPFITPSLMFVGDVAGKAEEAGKFYRSVFNNSKEGTVARYPKGMEPDKEGTVMFSDFTLEEQWFAVMDSAREHKFNFNEAISFLVNCEDQKEVDELWEKLSAVPESEVCGWLKDKYGVSWQIIPKRMGELLNDPDSEKANTALNAMLKMKKIDIAALEKASEGK